MLYGEVWVDLYKVVVVEVFILVDGVMIFGVVDDFYIGEDVCIK